MISSQRLLDEFRRNQVSHVVGLPDNGSKSLFSQLSMCTDMASIFVSREGEAFALASGLLVGGCKPLVLIQNTGLLEAGDAFRGTAFNMRLPLVIVIGYRGYAGHREGGDRVDSAATFLEPTLRAWQLPYTLMETDSDLHQVSAAFDNATAASLPQAIVLATQTH